MTPTQFRNAIARLDLSQERAGVFFGYSPRQGQRWAAKGGKVPRAVEIAIKLMLRFKVQPEEL